MEGILPEAIQWRRDKFDLTPHLIRGMLAHHRSMLEDVLLKDAENIAEYVDLRAVTDAYRWILNEPESANCWDFQPVWRTVVLALWLRQRRARRTSNDHTRKLPDAAETGPSRRNSFQAPNID
jgi:asparagine synthase (glutamine-hydrolysing)